MWFWFIKFDWRKTKRVSSAGFLTVLSPYHIVTTMKRAPQFSFDNSQTINCLFMIQCRLLQYHSDESPRNVVKQLWNGEILFWSIFCVPPTSGFGISGLTKIFALKIYFQIAEVILISRLIFWGKYPITRVYYWFLPIFVHVNPTSFEQGQILSRSSASYSFKIPTASHVIALPLLSSWRVLVLITCPTQQTKNTQKSENWKILATFGSATEVHRWSSLVELRAAGMEGPPAHLLTAPFICYRWKYKYIYNHSDSSTGPFILDINTIRKALQIQ